MWIKNNRKKALLLGFFYIVIVLFLTLRVPNKSIVLKGDLTPITNGIEIENKDNSNAFYSIYVVSMERPTIFQYVLSLLNSKVDIRDINETQNFSFKEQFLMGQIQEMLSYQYAVIAAYEKAAQEDTTISISKTVKGYILSYVDQRQSLLKVGDYITEINGTHYRELPENSFINILHEHDTVSLTILRGNDVKYLNITHIEDTKKYGLIINPVYHIETTPSYKETYSDDFIGGPSGGLLQALDIYSRLMALNLKGIEVSGTGTIEREGFVGPIGGIKQKVYTASTHDIDLFFVPTENYEEALIAYESLDNPSFILVKVGDFDEALEGLLAYLSTRS